MLLYILRHADADTEAQTDDQRRLSAKGKKQGEQVARFCAAHDLQPSLILSSPLPRAKETAQFVADETRTELLIVPWLASGMMPEAGLAEVQKYQARPSLMLVGHEPDLSGLIAHMVGLPSKSLIHIRKASLTALEISVFRPSAACLQFSIPCKLM